VLIPVPDILQCALKHDYHAISIAGIYVIFKKN